MVLPRPPRISVEIVFDFVCPWCYLGIHRFVQLRARRRDLSIQPVWRPFLLNPDMPRAALARTGLAGAGLARVDYTARRFGDEERARRFHAAIGEIAETEGLALDFGRIHHASGTVDAHRLVRFAAEAGAAEDLVLAVFRSYFTEGADLGDIGTLVRIAAGIGLDAGGAHRFLAGGGAAAQIHADNLHAHRLGINGVPCFVIEGASAIAGAQEPDVLERLIELAAAGAAY